MTLTTSFSTQLFFLSVLKRTLKRSNTLQQFWFPFWWRCWNFLPWFTQVQSILSPGNFFSQSGSLRKKIRLTLLRSFSYWRSRTVSSLPVAANIEPVKILEIQNAYASFFFFLFFNELYILNYGWSRDFKIPLKSTIQHPTDEFNIDGKKFKLIHFWRIHAVMVND